MAVSTFRDRARTEASRYGGSRWVFVRELLQNARDAGATQVAITAEREGGVERIHCRDNGEGMTFEHARRFLFTLYASSKGEQGSAGRFGIGFWSVLRFEPQLIRVRSRSSSADGWQVEMDGSLEQIRRTGADLDRGTEVLLERPARAPDLDHLVAEAARADARFLRQRDRPGAPVVITVNGRTVNQEFTLPAPSRAFSGRGVRGVVGLGPEPLVEVFAHGLRVRSAPLLGDLLSDEPQHPNPPPGGLMPRMILDGEELEVLLARNDLREDTALRRLVRRAERELERLVEAELDRAAPLGLAARLHEVAATAWRRSRLLQLATTIAVGICLGLTLGTVLDPLVAPGRRELSTASPSQLTPAAAPRPYRDLGATYPGPVVELPRQPLPPIDLAYSPPDQAVFLAASRVWGLDAEGAVIRHPDDTTLEPYPGVAGDGSSIEIQMGVEGGPGRIRLPVPTGHHVEAHRATLDGVPMDLWQTGNAEVAIVAASAVRGRLHFRTRAAAAPIGARTPFWPGLPPQLSSTAEALADLPLDDRVAGAVDLVRTRVEYDRGARSTDRHREAAAAGVPFVERTLAIGAGDCDVLNALLASILQAAGVESCLAVGWVGRSGRALPGLHAWVEYRDQSGRWRIADASAVAPSSPEGADPLRRQAHPATPSPAQGRAAPAQATVPPASGPIPGRDPRTPLLIAAGVALAALLGAAAAVLLIAARRARSGPSGPVDDTRLEELLQGALRRPQAFAHIHALFERPVVPLRDGRKISLQRCLRLSREARLYAGADASSLSKRAGRRGAAVLDSASAEGRAVASLLAAKDLDEWAAVLARRQSTPATDRVNLALRRAGEPARVFEISGKASLPRVLDLQGLDPDLPAQLVLVPSAGPLADTVAHSPEAVGAFALADATVHALGLPETRCARVLSPLAGLVLICEVAE